MKTVPMNKRLYIGSHKFIEGEVIPPHFALELPTEKAAPKKRGPYRPRVKKIDEIIGEDASE